MTWVNVLDVPGVTAAVVGTSLGSGPTPTIAGGKMVFGTGFDTLAAGSAKLEITDTAGTLAATPEFPAISVRVTYDLSGMTAPPTVKAIAAYNGMTFNSGQAAGQIFDPPAPVTSLHTYSTGAPFGASLGYDNAGGGPLDGATVMIEVDITAPDPPDPEAFWTDHVGTKEIIE